ncbi:hypothetical protein DPMN_090759 [Dreissena polymorpha]|uniref:Uncharacterized protein n=1 Tax=Dreissena polymorpha TaxID=45954 RepID=A0A9D4QZB1_DREPO|nr:hypothetical protein DPMN_090759 [Dreissena polymorpha]
MSSEVSGSGVEKGGFGVMGLDWTTPKQDLPLQERMFVGLLELACRRRPVILNLRGRDR